MYEKYSSSFGIVVLEGKLDAKIPHAHIDFLLWRRHICAILNMTKMSRRFAFNVHTFAYLRKLFSAIEIGRFSSENISYSIRRFIPFQYIGWIHDADFSDDYLQS